MCAVDHWSLQIISFLCPTPQASHVSLYELAPKAQGPTPPIPYFVRLSPALSTVTHSIQPFKDYSNEHKAGGKMSINIGWVLTSAYSSSALSLYPACRFTSTQETASPSSSSLLNPLPTHPRALRLHCVRMLYAKPMAQKVISWHRANTTLGKLDTQSNRRPSKWAKWSLKSLSGPIFLCLCPSVSSAKSFTFLVEIGSSNFHNVRFQIFPIPQSATEDFHKLWNTVSTGIHSDIKNMLVGVSFQILTLSIFKYISTPFL